MSEIAAEGVEQFADALIHSDRRYFELGATRTTGNGVDVLSMSGLHDVPAGCVAICHTAPVDADAARRRIDWVEATVRRLGAPRYRWYDNSGSAVMAVALGTAGYRPSREIGLFGATVPALDLPSVEVRRVASSADWQAKLELHRSDPKAPDGHVVDGERWVAMERTKQDAGGLEFYVAEHAGAVCGTVGAMRQRNMLRMKNIVVGAEWRGRGIGTALTAAMIECALRGGHAGLGLFALADGSALSIYERLDMEPVVEQTEWVKDV